MNELIKAYMERMKEIRLLSSPKLEGINSAEEYEKKLLSNYRRIGELGLENRKMIKNTIEPLVYADRSLTKEELTFLDEMTEALFNPVLAEQLDLSMGAMLMERIYTECLKEADDAEILNRIDMAIAVYYMLQSSAIAIFTAPQLQLSFQQKAIKLYEKMELYLEHDRFLKLDRDSKTELLVNVCYIAVLYEAPESFSIEEKYKYNEKRIKALRKALEVYNDPFYRENAPEYKWEKYILQLYYYYALMSPDVIPPHLLAEVKQHHAKLIEEVNKMPADEKFKFEEIYPLNLNNADYLYKQYIAGEIDYEKYRKELLTIFEKYVSSGKSRTCRGMFMAVNILYPLMKILSEKKILSYEDEEYMNRIYRDFLEKIFKLEIDDGISQIVSGIMSLIQVFREIPGGISYKDAVITLFAAIHPPTYVHCKMVARISSFLASHLLLRKPELFTAICGCKNVEDIEEHREDILNFTYNAALCHDFGKIGIMDTIYIYGRALLDSEYGLLKEHPLLGATLLKMHNSTQAYADIALGHHRWYDDTKGYPEDFKTADSPYKTIIDIVCCADCMDAATDSVGRSYNKGKTFDDFKKEVEEGAGTRYAPFLIELFNDPSVCKELKQILSEGRHKTYRETYNLLKTLQV